MCKVHNRIYTFLIAPQWPAADVGRDQRILSHARFSGRLEFRAGLASVVGQSFSITTYSIIRCPVRTADLLACATTVWVSAPVQCPRFRATRMTTRKSEGGRR